MEFEKTWKNEEWKLHEEEGPPEMVDSDDEESSEQAPGLDGDSDSEEYLESIFQSAWTTTNEYAEIDKDLIRLLYHPDVNIGLNENQLDEVLREILINE